MTGSGTQQDPYIIYNVDDLQAMQDDLDAYYELANDIDASETEFWNEGAGFLPVPQSGGFTGQLDGKGYKITDLYINRAYAALFDYLNGATIKNLGLVNVSITATAQGAALARGVEDSTIENCHSSGIVTVIGSSCEAAGLLIDTMQDEADCEISKCSSSCAVSASGSRCTAGGLLAMSTWGIPTIENCYATGDVSATGNAATAGGFVGYTSDASIFTKCYATGTVTAAAPSGSSFPATGGGFVGFTCNAETFSRCYATGNVIGSGDKGGEVGGFVGFTCRNETISDCYARGDVTAPAGLAIGGFASGHWPDDGMISRCYSTGAINGSGAYAGGFCGSFIPYNSGGFSACFWDTETSGTETGIGDNPSSEVVGKTSALMKTKSTFTDAGWDFSTPIWYIGPTINDGYPAFTGGIVIPIVTTDPVTALGTQQAILNGTLDDDGGEACDCGFEWGETIVYGNTTPTESKNTGEIFLQPITGLDPNKTYHFRAFATNSAGTGYGADMVFTTLVAIPTVTTDSVTALGSMAVTLNGTLVDDGGEACDCGFEWGKSIAYGNTTPTESKTTGQTFSHTIVPLEPGTEYHFRAFARNSVGIGYGADVIFRTYPVFSRGYALSREEM